MTDRLITVKQAEEIVKQAKIDFSAEEADLTDCIGRVLKDPILADRDFPPFHRVMMDGIAIRYSAIEEGISNFTIAGLQAAGTIQQTLVRISDCIEVMTGSVLPIGADTVIPYELININNNVATLKSSAIFNGQHVHLKGSDRKRNEELIPSGTRISSAEMGVLATVGQSKVRVLRTPRIAIVSTGDELVDIEKMPAPHQIRKSNSYALLGALKSEGLEAACFHLKDNREEIKDRLVTLLENFDVLLFSGGVSMGKKDFLPEVFDELGVHKLFHKVAQRPGKPFWFGRKENKVVFGFPGNPVSTFVCFYKYFIPWYYSCINQKHDLLTAYLDTDVEFKPSLTYFLPVKLHFDHEGRLIASPRRGNGSGDLTNLIGADGFLELPDDKDSFPKGSGYPCIRYRG